MSSQKATIANENFEKKHGIEKAAILNFQTLRSSVWVSTGNKKSYFHSFAKNISKLILTRLVYITF